MIQLHQWPWVEASLLAVLPGLGAIRLAMAGVSILPLIVYPVMGVITFALYAEDKKRAKQEQWRISENSLHLCEFLGGWLGGFIAQRRFRHKSIKASYQFIFWCIVGMHLIFWLGWVVFGGAVAKSIL